MREECAVGRLLPDQLHQDPFSPLAIKLAVKNLFPGPKIKAPRRDRDHHFPAHDLPLEVRIPIVFPSPVVVISAQRLMGGEIFQPAFKIPMQARFIVIDEDRGGDVHGIDEGEALLNATFMETAIDVLGDIHKTHAVGGIPPKFFAEAFHDDGEEGIDGK